MDIKRGEIYYIETFAVTGSEQRPGRPAVIVSNDENNKHSATVEVVYLTTQPKTDLPTHTIVGGCIKESIAICEQVTTVALERIGDYKGTVSEEEMAAIEDCMLISLGMERKEPEYYEDDESSEDLMRQLAESEARYELLQQMYDALLDKVVRV